MIIDVLCLGAAGYGFMMGFKEGIVNSIFRFLSMFIALMAAFKFSPYVTEVLEKAFEMYNPLMFIVGFIVVFFVVMWILRFVGELLTQGLEFAHINFANQLIGGFILAFIFVVLYSLLVWFADGANILSNQTKNESRTYVYLTPLPQKTFAFVGDVRPIFSKFFKETNRVMDEVQRARVERKESKTDIYDIQEDNQAQPQQPNPQNR
jgi:membrane protein required for colicin V production